MKSIMEEASTISKAIENAWNRAGQPQEFSVKILEHPKTTFFGLKTEKSAKIAFFFNELAPKSKDYAHTRPIQQKTHHKGEQQGRKSQDGHARTENRGEGRHEHPRRQESREQRHDSSRYDTPRHETSRTERPDRHEARAQRHETPRKDHRPEMREQRVEQNQERHDASDFAKHKVHPEHVEGSDRSTGSQPSHRASVFAKASPDMSADTAPRVDHRERRPEFKERRHDDRRENTRRYEDRRHDNHRDNREGSAPRFNGDESRDTWTPDMVQSVQEWVKETLVLMGKPDITITPHVSNSYLKLSLDNQVSDDARQEETQLKSWGSLAMESLREKTNKPLRGLRIVLESKR